MEEWKINAFYRKVSLSPFFPDSSNAELYLLNVSWSFLFLTWSSVVLPLPPSRSPSWAFIELVSVTRGRCSSCNWETGPILFNQTVWEKLQYRIWQLLEGHSSLLWKEPHSLIGKGITWSLWNDWNALKLEVEHFNSDVPTSDLFWNMASNMTL